MLFGLIPVDSPRLNHVLDLMENASLLYSSFGLRSLARSDDMFGTVDNYWRGPIWVNINFLTLRALNRYYTSDGPYAERAKTIYSTLRRNLIGNLYKNWKKNGGDLYENYNAISGSGQGQHPFAGWTSLLVLIMAETY
jgi:mannosyl-oligosaccharide glucosidase